MPVDLDKRHARQKLYRQTAKGKLVAEQARYRFYLKRRTMKSSINPSNKPLATNIRELVKTLDHWR